MIDTEAGLASLNDLVRTSSSSGVARRALLFRTDRLPPARSKTEQLKQAWEALAPLESAERAQRHDLPGGRIVMSWKGDPARLLGQTMDGLNRILVEHAAAPSLQLIVGLFDLPEQGDALLAAASAGVVVETAVTDPAELDEIAPAQPHLQPLELAKLDLLEQRLSGTDMRRFARRRPVSCFVGQTAQLAWEERTLSIPELIETVAPGRDARSDIWLFRRLTRLLDRRMLSILSDVQELRGVSPFSITLNVASVLSQEFLRFDAALPATLRSNVVISFLPADIASDAAAFAFARNFARSRSYRVCLRAVSSRLLPALDLAALDLDFVQLIWSGNLERLTTLPNPGRAQWIVGQPCTPEAVVWGRKQGVSLFTIKPTQ